jgi:hypothetical protein
VVRGFARLGYREVRRPSPLRAHLAADGRAELRLALRPTGGRIFGGTYALEVSTAAPVLPPTGGVTARGRGLARLKRIDFRPRGKGREGELLAARLSSDRELFRALGAVHFEQVRVDPDGRPSIRHMGGSLVWLLFPPMARPVPITAEQVRATVAALDAFREAGQRADDATVR